MKTYIPTLSLCIVLLIASCSSYRYVDIQILNPGAIKFPTKNIKFIIVDPGKTGSISKDSANQPFCWLAINSFNSTLTRQLEQSPLFQDTSVKILKTPIIIHQNDSTESIKRKIYIDSLKQLYSNEKDDFILLNYGFYISGVELHSYYGRKVLNSKFQFKLSNLKTREVYNWYQTSDKQTWWRLDQTDNGSLAIKNACRNVAESYARRLAPYWTTEERIILYSPNKMMRKAYNYFCDNNLDKAVEIWKRLYDIGTRKLSSRAAYNIALVYEMQDDLNSSENWLVKSIQRKVNQSSREYLEIIRNRKLVRISLDNQL